MKILVIGANGFLGSHIVKKCLSEGDEIYAVSLHTHRLDSIMDKIQFSNCKLNKLTSIESKIKSFNADLVIHCAWDGGNSYTTVKLPSQFYKNIPGIVDLMGIIKRNNIPYFIGIGSVLEFGNKKHIITEKSHETPNNLYGTCKLMAKLYTEQFCKAEKIKWSWLRPFYTYGPDDISTRLIPSVINCCIKKERVMLNKCNHFVDYLYIDDFVSAVSAIITNKKDGVFNICSSKSYNIKSIVKKIGCMTNNAKNLFFGVMPERDEYPLTIFGSGAKLELATGWKPKISLNNGLTKTIKYYNQKLYDK